MMGSGLVRSPMMDRRGVRGFVMYRFRVRRLVMYGFGVSSLVMDRFWVRGFVMDRFWVRGFVMDRFWVRGFVMDRFWVRGFVMDRFGVSGLVMDSRGVSTGGGVNRGVRVAVINRVVLVPVISSFLLKRALRLSCLDMTLVRCRLFTGSRSRVDSAGAVEADVIIDSSVVDYCTVNVGVVDDGRIHVPNCCVIPKDVALPPAAVETGSVITGSVVDTPVESNVGTPITVVPTIVATHKTPVTRGPKVSRLGHLNPSARNPEIIVISVGPVARTPKISLRRTRRLFVDHEGRRRHGNRDSLSEKRGRRAQQTR
jgi:hypothetical protein